MGGGEARIPVFFLAARRQGRAVGFLGECVAGGTAPLSIRAPGCHRIHFVFIHRKQQNLLSEVNDSVA